MTTDVSTSDDRRPSAQIIPFPAGGRRAAAIGRGQTKPAGETRAPQVSFGAWYHDEAIVDSKLVS